MRHFKKFFVLIIKGFVWVSIIAVVTSDSEVVICSIHPNLHCEVSACRHFNHVSIKHDIVYLSLFINFIGSYFNFKLFTWIVLHNILVLAEKVLLTRSEAVDTETSNHDRAVRSERDCIPGCLRVAPATCRHSLESKEVMQIALALKAQQFVPIHDAFLVEHVRIAQFLLFMIKVDEVRRTLCNLSSILK